MAKPPVSPGGLRSPRKRAIEIGTDGAGFEDLAAGYNTHTGTPDDMSGGTYEDRVATTPDPGSSASNNENPFKLGQ